MALSEKRIRELEKAERKLEALENAGVDNWDGYNFAMEAIRKEEEYDEFMEQIVSDIADAIGECIEEPAGQGCGYGIREQGYVNIENILRKYQIQRKK
jgi:hypothetical protein